MWEPKAEGGNGSPPMVCCQGLAWGGTGGGRGLEVWEEYRGSIKERTTEPTIRFGNGGGESSLHGISKKKIVP